MTKPQKSNFDAIYDTGQKTEAYITKDELSEQPSENIIQNVDYTKYGLNKPERIIIQAEIIHDKSKKRKSKD